MAKHPAFDPRQTLLDLLRAQRAQAGVTQEQLAARLGLRQTDISKVERGIRRLDVLELRSWLGGLNMPLLDFMADLDQRLSAGEHLAARLVGRSPQRARPGSNRTD